MDMERITLTYADADALLADCRLLGRNLHRERFAAMRGKQWLAKLKAGLLDLAKSDAQGRLSLTVEVIYGHALKPLPRLKVQSESSMSLSDMRTLLSVQTRGNRPV
jgi:malonyl-CoA O-methyltransferase